MDTEALDEELEAEFDAQVQFLYLMIPY
jgi:hypothetical protein